jgi:hypothetical protein
VSKNEESNEDLVRKVPNPIDEIASLTLRKKRLYNEGKFAGNYPGPLYAPHPDIKK